MVVGLAAGCKVTSVGSLLDELFRPYSAAKDGRYRDGLREGEWILYYVEDGRRASRKAHGSYAKDDQVGPWEYYYRNERKEWAGSFDARSGLQGPCEFFYEDGTTLAMGGFKGGLEEGPWVFYDRSGAKVMEGGFAGGVRTGTWTFYDPASGAKSAEGRYAKDAPVSGSWRFWDPSGAEALADEATLAELAVRPVIPIRSQPDLTDVEEHFLPVLYAFQREGEDQSSRVAEELGLDVYMEGREGVGGGRYGGASNPARRDEERSRALRGRKLGDLIAGFEDFTIPTGDLDSVKLADLARDKKLVLVLLRGMQRDVCIYCQMQTAALCELYENFEQIGAEVLIVYPGDRNRKNAFLEQYEEFVDEYNAGIEEYRSQMRERFPGDLQRLDAAIPEGLKIGIDPQLALTDALGVRDDLARPTTLICDEEGVIRYAYVGMAGFPEDRPAVRKLLDLAADI